MEKMAATLVYEHSVHSLILDPEDPIWGDVFTEEELTEIRRYNTVTLPELPETLQGCLDGFYVQDWKTGIDVLNYARNMRRHPIQEPDLYWIERSTQAISHLFPKSDTLSFEGHSEAEALHLFWSFCYTLYDNEAVQAKIGERASTAVATGRNIFREISTGAKRRRKTVGAKLDILFRSGATELGCCEIGRLDVTPVDTKYIDDGFFKMPKTLRDMLVTLFRQKPGALEKLTTVGYLLMGTKMQLVMMDFPHNLYISRVTRTTNFDFPMTIGSVASELPTLLDLVWKGKAIMVDTLDKLGKRRATIGFEVNKTPAYSFNKDI